MNPKVTTEHNKGKAKIFKSPVLESLTKTTPLSNIIIYGLAIVFAVYYALNNIGISILTFSGLFLFGVLFWTFAEYMLHRYIFHWVTEAKWSQRFHFIMHGAHHLYPTDKERLLMPPVPGFIMAGFLFCIFYLIFYIFGIPILTFGFFPGFFSGYLMYSFVHRATHIMKAPKGFENLWLHHQLHHYKYPEKAFGVSNVFWDKVFGTMPPKMKN